MISRLTFFLIAVFWVAMNVLLWRAEYDSNGTGIRVPVALVWQKILTAPDISSLNVFQDGQRTGFCRLSTSVEQEMAALDEGDLVPKNIHPRSGYQIRCSGSVNFGDYPNRLTFSGELEFSGQREWREIYLKLSSYQAKIEIHSLAADQNVHLKIASDGGTNEMVFSFAELQNPETLLRLLPGSFGKWAVGLDLPPISRAPTTLAQDIHWEAHSDRLTLDGRSVPVYRVETRILDHPVVIYVSTLGEILQVKLPGGIVASFGDSGNL